MQPRLPPAPPKPISRIWRPERTRLARLHWPRRLFRLLLRGLARVLSRLLMRVEIRRRENLPQHPALYVTNHLGDADAALVLAVLPVAPEVLGKIELLFEFPLLGRLMDWYGTIWLHRGVVDRRPLALAVRALREGRSLIIAPEGRYTLTGGLERGTSGAAFVALRAHVPIVPIALTGTRNAAVYSSLVRLRRPAVSLTVGAPFELTPRHQGARTLRLATREIMESIARLLPPGYRGAYLEGATE